MNTSRPARRDLRSATADIPPKAQLATGVFEGPVRRRLLLGGAPDRTEDVLEQVAAYTDRHARALQGRESDKLVRLLGVAQAQRVARQPGGA